MSSKSSENTTQTTGRGRPTQATMVAMDRLPVLRLLLSPSLLSGTLVLGASLAVCVVGAWSYISVNGLFYDFLFGPSGLQSVLVQAPDKLSLLRHILSSQLAYYVLVISAGVISSITAYAGLQAAGNLHKDLDLLQKERPYNQSFRQALLSRLWVKLLGSVSWACFTLFFLNLVAPCTLLLLRTGIDMFETGTTGGSIAMCAAAVTLLAACLHIHTVFLRIVLLRYRVFGGTDVLTEEKMHTLQ